MGVKTGISWTDHTFNPWWGCSRVSPGCVNCYAEAQAARFGTGWGTQAPRRFFGDVHWREPLAWDRAAEAAGRPSFVFCSSMADVFEVRTDTSDPLDTGIPMAQALDVQRRRLWDLIAATPRLVWLLLTKRPQNVRALVPTAWMNGAWPANVWIGVTTEDQQRADERLPVALSLPAPMHFASYEPALGMVDFRPYLYGAEVVDWIIVGGESGPRARPFNVRWADSTVAQCRGTETRAFVKQMGAAPFADEGRDADLWAAAGVSRIDDMGRIHCIQAAGSNPVEWPEWLRVRERPEPLPMVRR